MISAKGKSLSGHRNFISKHSDDHIDLVLLAGTNDLANRNVSPEDLKPSIHRS